MSRVPTPRRHDGGAGRSHSAASRLLLLIATFVAVFGITPVAAQAAESTGAATTRSDLCRAWDAPADDPKVTLDGGQVIAGDTRQRIGSDCQAAGASVLFTQAEVDTNPSTSGPAGTAAARVLAAVEHAAAGDGLAEGDEVFKNAFLRSFEVQVYFGYVYYRGKIEVQWSGGTKTIFQFSGNVYDFNKFRLNVFSPGGGTSLPNVGGSPLAFNGSLFYDAGKYTLDLTGKADSLIVGEGEQRIGVSGADLALSLADTDEGQRLKLGVTGLVTIGTAAKVNGSISADFDDAGLKSLSGGGALDVTIPAKANSPEGRATGDATIDMTREPQKLSVTFNGTVRVGGTTIASATGALDQNSLTLAGNLSYSDTGARLSAKGAVEGMAFFGPDLTGLTVSDKSGTQVPATKGDFLLKTASGEVTAQGLTAKGAVQVGNVGTQKWVAASGAIDTTFTVNSQATSLKGSATIDWLAGSAPAVTFDGSVESGSTLIAGAKGSVDGKKIVFKGDVTVANPDLTIKGGVDGTVFYGTSVSGETVTNRAGNSVAATRGDFFLKAESASIKTKGFELSGNVSLGRVGTERWATGGGAVDLTYSGTNVKGNASMTWVSGEIPAVAFEGAVSSGGVQLASAKGEVDGNKLALKADGTLAVGGLTVKGAVDGVVFYGTDLAGQNVKNFAGDDVQAQKGDFLVKSASADVDTGGFSLKGETSIGKAGSELWAKGGGSIDLTYGDTNVKGSATAEWQQGKTPAIAFDGTVTSGTTTVAGASGTFDGSKIALKGNVAYSADGLELAGAVDGVVFYGNDLSGETVKNRDGDDVTPAKGDFVLTSAAGSAAIKGLELAGAVSIHKVAGDLWVTAGGLIDVTVGGTRVMGSADVAWAQGGNAVVNFEGAVKSGDVEVASAKGTIDGNKVEFAGAVQLAGAGIGVKGAVDGVVFYGSDLSGEQVKNRAGTDVTPAKGDFFLKSASGEITAKGITASGNVSVGKVAGEVWAKGGGAVDLSFATTELKGTATIDWVQGSVPSVTFSGSVKTDGVELASAEGAVDGSKIALKAQGQLSTSGITVKGAIDGVVFYGNDLAGQKIKNRAGIEVQATKGDINVASTSADVAANGFTLKGAASFGKVGGELWAKGGGAVDLTYGATNLKGSATADWVAGQVPAITFAGSVTSGTTTVAGASGTFDANKIALKGNASFQDPALTIGGSVDGTLYYGNDLSAEKVKNRLGVDVTPAKGDYVLTSAAGNVSIKGLALTGNVSLAKVAGEMWASAGGSIDATYNGTTIKGSANVAWAQGQAPSVSFDGSVTSGGVTIASAKGTIDGNKIAFAGSAQLTGSGISAKGAIDGIVFFGSDLTGEKITNRAGASVQAARGDFLVKSASGEIAAKGITAKGAVSFGKVGSESWVKGGGSVDLTFSTTNIKGAADIDWVAGQVPAVTFSGAIKSGDIEVASASGTVDGKKIALRAAGQLVNSNLSIKSTVDVIVFYGDDLTGETITNRAGAQVQATKGDLLLKGASADIVAKGFTLKGAVQFGKVGSAVWAKGGGSVDLTYGATKLVGSADVDWVMGQIPAVNFAGSLTNGNAFVGSASGTLDGKKIALKGQATINDPAGVIKGAVDGVIFYGDNLAGETIANRAGTLVEPLKGDYNLKGASGSIETKGLSLSGNISMGNVRGDRWATGGGAVDVSFTQNGVTTRIQGQAASLPDGTVTFSGSLKQGDVDVASVSGTVDGNKLTFEGQLSTPTMSGKAKGTIFYGSNLAGQTIVNKAGATVQAQKGDFSFEITDGRLSLKQLLATANFSVKRVGADWWVNAAAQIKTGDNWLTFTGSIDSSWNFNLKGAGVITMDGYRLEFNGTALLRENRLVLDGTVAVVTNLFTVQLTGTIEKPDMNVNQYSFFGKASFKFGGYSIANASVKLVFGEGLITSFTIKICILFVCPTGTYKVYFEGGNVSKVQLNVSLLYWAQFRLAATIAAPGVPVESKITGIL